MAQAKEEQKFDDDEFGLQRSESVDTSLLIYFFGKKGFDQVCKVCSAFRHLRFCKKKFADLSARLPFVTRLRMQMRKI